jgi:hypothetical protein
MASWRSAIIMPSFEILSGINLLWIVDPIRNMLAPCSVSVSSNLSRSSSYGSKRAIVSGRLTRSSLMRLTSEYFEYSGETSAGRAAYFENASLLISLSHAGSLDSDIILLI